jgi:hypothetical protein
MIAATPWLGSAQAEVQIGADNNNIDNPFVQPEDPAQSGGGRDQSLQNGDSLVGTRRADVQIGLLGIDVLQGRRGRDVQIGGPDPTPPNNDRAFGGPGADVFLWQPGDGSDLFDGGPRVDAIVFGNITSTRRPVCLSSIPTAACRRSTPLTSPASARSSTAPIRTTRRRSRISGSTTSSGSSPAPRPMTATPTVTTGCG